MQNFAVYFPQMNREKTASKNSELFHNQEKKINVPAFWVLMAVLCNGVAGSNLGVIILAPNSDKGWATRPFVLVDLIVEKPPKQLTLTHLLSLHSNLSLNIPVILQDIFCLNYLVG